MLSPAHSHVIGVPYLPGEAQPVDGWVVQTQNHGEEGQQVLLLLTAETQETGSETDPRQGVPRHRVYIYTTALSKDGRLAPASSRYE